MKNIKTYLFSFLTVTSLGLVTDSFALLGLTKTSAATSSSDLLLEFQKMESGHKADCIKHMQEEKDAFFKLVAQEQKECSKLHAQALKKFAALNGSNNEKTFSEVLNDAVALHAKEKAEKRAAHEKMEQAGRDLMAKHDKEFNAFVMKANLQTKVNSNEPESVLLGRKVVSDAPDLPSE